MTSMRADTAPDFVDNAAAAKSEGVAVRPEVRRRASFTNSCWGGGRSSTTYRSVVASSTSRGSSHVIESGSRGRRFWDAVWILNDVRSSGPDALKRATSDKDARGNG
jgi:hypothetical protein